MNYRKLGKTGLMVSEIGFGPEWMTGTPEETRAIAEVLREAGVNYLDCWMPDPHIRANLGYAMKGHTDEWIVQGHIGACWVDGQYLRSRDVALAKPAFDLMPASEDVNDLFGDLEEAGEQLEPLRAELYSLCEEKEIALTVMKPYAGGRLLMDEQSPFGKALTPVQCIHYCLMRPAVASVLAGYQSVEEAQAALAYEQASEEERDFAQVIAAAPARKAYFGQCTYCGHCQPCAVGIDIATVNKFADLASIQDTVPQSIRAHYLELDKNASDCIACGNCEPNCPFGVKIVDRMEETERLFA